MTSKISILFVLILTMLPSCGLQRSDKTIINLSFTPWVGYYPFYFAIEKQIPQQHGAELRILETLSIQDFRRTNIKEHVDAFACSLMELTRTNGVLDNDIEVVAFLDYSDGADVIVARNDISSMADLKNKVIGFDWRSLGHYFFTKALKSNNLDDSNYVHRQVEQVLAAEYFREGLLDAYVTFPPISTRLLEDKDLHIIFDSSLIPYQIMDVLAIKKGNRVKSQALFHIWRDVSEYINNNPDEYTAFVANLMNVKPEVAIKEISQVMMIDEQMQSNIKRVDLVNLILGGCEILGEESATCISKLQKIHFDDAPILKH